MTTRPILLPSISCVLPGVVFGLAWAALALIAPEVRAQGASGSPGGMEGRRVRVTGVNWLPEVESLRAVGVLASMTADSVRIGWQNGTYSTLATSQIARLEESQGRHSFARRGMGLGFVSGAAAGALMGGLAYQENGSNSRGSNMALAALFLSAPGALVGALVGAVGQREAWTLLQPSDTSAMGLDTFVRDASPGFRLRVRF